MKRFLPLILSATLSAPFLFAAQTPGQAVMIDASDLEDFRRMAGRLDQLEDAYSVAQKRIGALTAEIDSMRNTLKEGQDNQTRKMVDVATREDLKSLVESIKKVDADRANDKKVILEAIEKMGKDISKAPISSASRGSDSGEKTPDKPKNDKKDKDLGTDKASTNSKSELVYTYTVAPGDNLSKVIAAYNQAMKEQGKQNVTIESIRRANPKMNLNNIYVGQEIVIPVPPEKK